MDALHQKYEALRQILKDCGSVAVAFSSGVDSAFLLYVAHQTLGEKALAVTARSFSFPKREQEESVDFCKRYGIRQIIVQTGDLQLDCFRTNPPDRCYHCKKAIFTALLDIAAQNGMAAVADGSNMDDLGDYRPGMKALREAGVRSPLQEAGLTKEEIRQLSCELGLPTWDKPSFACLASRFVYGEEITEEKLRMVERAEQLLLDLGFRQLRVRIHGKMARIELLPEDIARFMSDDVRMPVYDRLKALGFSYVTLDLGGFRTGSMNDLLTKEEKQL